MGYFSIIQKGSEEMQRLSKANRRTTMRTVRNQGKTKDDHMAKLLLEFLLRTCHTPITKLQKDEEPTLPADFTTSLVDVVVSELFGGSEDVRDGFFSLLTEQMEAKSIKDLAQSHLCTKEFLVFLCQIYPHLSPNTLPEHFYLHYLLLLEQVSPDFYFAIFKENCLEMFHALSSSSNPISLVSISSPRDVSVVLLYALSRAREPLSPVHAAELFHTLLYAATPPQSSSATANDTAQAAEDLTLRFLLHFVWYTDVKNVDRLKEFVLNVVQMPPEMQDTFHDMLQRELEKDGNGTTQSPFFSSPSFWSFLVLYLSHTPPNDEGDEVLIAKLVNALNTLPATAVLVIRPLVEQLTKQRAGAGAGEGEEAGTGAALSAAPATPTDALVRLAALSSAARSFLTAPKFVGLLLSVLHFAQTVKKKLPKEKEIQNRAEEQAEGVWKEFFSQEGPWLKKESEDRWHYHDRSTQKYKKWEARLNEAAAGLARRKKSDRVLFVRFVLPYLPTSAKHHSRELFFNKDAFIFLTLCLSTFAEAAELEVPLFSWLAQGAMQKLRFECFYLREPLERVFLKLCAESEKKSDNGKEKIDSSSSSSSSSDPYPYSNPDPLSRPPPLLTNQRDCMLVCLYSSSLCPVTLSSFYSSLALFSSAAAFASEHRPDEEALEALAEHCASSRFIRSTRSAEEWAGNHPRDLWTSQQTVAMVLEQAERCRAWYALGTRAFPHLFDICLTHPIAPPISASSSSSSSSSPSSPSSPPPLLLSFGAVGAVLLEMMGGIEGQKRDCPSKIVLAAVRHFRLGMAAVRVVRTDPSLPADCQRELLGRMAWVLVTMINVFLKCAVKVNLAGLAKACREVVPLVSEISSFTLLVRSPPSSPFPPLSFQSTGSPEKDLSFQLVCALWIRKEFATALNKFFSQSLSDDHLCISLLRSGMLSQRGGVLDGTTALSDEMRVPTVTLVVDVLELIERSSAEPRPAFRSGREEASISATDAENNRMMIADAAAAALEEEGMEDMMMLCAAEQCSWKHWFDPDMDNMFRSASNALVLMKVIPRSALHERSLYSKESWRTSYFDD